ncbi:phosphatidylinositol-specific phospholipase C [Ceratobasidium sp. AG-Ba]|nr:phosphatidylinositol-specific phospholipase C [Ceratobasidium sp. AG-Ba]QRW14722.1 phosphatidylinositol-specific phospholipase C [Ceratobasidium sp. AG-Ba]
MPSVPVSRDFEHGAGLSTDDSSLDDIRLSSNVLEIITQAGLTEEGVIQSPLAHPPPLDDSHPLPAYFVSSSHNTYLLSRQIFAKSSAASYTHVLTHGGRCVEIDAWDSSEGPIVTHGYAFTQSISFQSVCEAIGQAVGPNDLPVMVSLECHASPSTQETMVKIMTETWGDKLLSREIEGIEGMARLRDVRGKILLMVEWYPPASRAPPKDNDSSSSSSSSSSSDDEDDEGDQRQRSVALAGEQAQKNFDSRIASSLAALGVYAKSVKPHAITEPLHCLLNISENALTKLLPHRLEALVQTGHIHQTRVYPRGTRVQSTNLNPLKAWRAGAQIAALNWQSFDVGMQLNHAMFHNTGGWVLKSAYQRGQGELAGNQSARKFTCKIYGVSNLPHPEDTKSNDSVSVYVRVELMHTSQDLKHRTKTVKGAPSSESTHNSLDIMWDESFTWEITPDDLAFIRFVVVEDKFAFDEPFAVYCARMTYVQEGLRLAHLRDLTGRKTGSTILVNVEWS